MAPEAHSLDHPIPFEAAPDGAWSRPARGRADPRRSAASLIPTVRYRDVPAAVGWLCTAFGMEVHRVVRDENGAACYAELAFGSSLLMIAPIEDTAFGRLMVQPDEIGGVETQVCYLFVEDAWAHYARAKAAGAVVILEPEHEANGGRGYSCRDPEGHVWNFGTYDPWQRQRAGMCAERRPAGREQQGLVALLLLSLALVATAEAVPPPPGAGAVIAEARAAEPPTAGPGLAEPPPAPEPPRVETELPAAEPPPPKAEAAAAEPPEPGPSAEEVAERRAQRAALEAAERAAAEARTKLAEASGAREKAERDAATIRVALEAARNAKGAAERDAEDMRQRLKAAKLDAEEARRRLQLEQKRRAATGRAARADRRASRFVRRPRLWCYRQGGPNVAPSRAARLSGFCRF